MAGTNLDPSVTATTFYGSLVGNQSQGVPQFIAAAGATQGVATLITSALAILTVCTASARGIKLPVAVTGLMVEIFSLCTQGVKVYPNTNGKITTSATNVALVLAGFKANMFVAKNTTQWALLKGA